MHLFFDTVWKLHIGEIPEKPDINANNNLDEYDMDDYNEAIAAIKQNALTVGNHKIIPLVGNDGYPIFQRDGNFHKWPGEYTIKYGEEFKLLQKPVAILTLPEEKKNTMENMTWISLKSEWPDEHENVLWCTLPVCEPYWFGCIIDDDWRESYTHWMRIPEPPTKHYGKDS